MTNIKALYPRTDSDYFSAYSYQPMIDSFGEVVIQVDDKDYQGDTRVIFKKGRNYGYLNFGWGSCSGCDALQACENYEDLQKLFDRLESSIQWFSSLKSLKNFFNTHDWEADYHSNDVNQQDFIAKVKALS